MVNDNATFTCTATGIPLPTITWMNGSIMLMGSDMIINSTTILSTLTLSNLQDDDFENYTCTATNMFGSDNVTALLGSKYQVLLSRSYGCIPVAMCNILISPNFAHYSYRFLGM